MLESRLCCGSLLVFNVCILTMESLTAIFAKWKAVKITAKRVRRSICRLIVIEQSPVEDKITKFFSHMLQDIETFNNRHILLVLWRYIVSLTGYPFAFWIRMQLFATFVIHRANWKKELSILASFTLPFSLLLLLPLIAVENWLNCVFLQIWRTGSLWIILSEAPGINPNCALERRAHTHIAFVFSPFPNRLFFERICS